MAAKPVKLTDATTVRLLLTSLQRVTGWTAPQHPREHDVYLFGLRNASDKVGPWDDALGALVGNASGGWDAYLWRGTTDPGRETGGNRDGIACLVPGRYRACWVRGLHKGRRALVQAPSALFKVWRDTTPDGRVQRTGRIYSNVGGLNAHGPGRDVLGAVQGYSLGCQVTHTDADHAERMALADAQVAAGMPDSFSYMLVDLRDAPELGPLLGRVGVV